MWKRFNVFAAGVVALVGAQGAMAQLTDIASTNVDGLLGVSTAGSETGIHEMATVVPVGLGVCIVIALSFAGYHLVRRLFMRGQSA